MTWPFPLLGRTPATVENRGNASAHLLRLGTLAGLLLVLFSRPDTQAAAVQKKTTSPPPVAAPTNSPVTPIVIPKSIFVSDLATAAPDPFFPNSPRRRYGSPPNGDGTKTRALAAVNLLNLRGVINGPGQRRLALINNQVFAVGDALLVASSTTTNLVRCLEIQSNSVVIVVEGLRKILVLPK